MIKQVYINAIIIAPRTEIAITSSSFLIMLRNSSSFLKFLIKLLILIWNTETSFNKSFYLARYFFQRKVWWTTTSNLLLRKFLSGSPLPLFKICWKSKGLKKFSWELAEFSSWRFARQYSGFIDKRFRFYEKISIKTYCFLYFPFVTILS